MTGGGLVGARVLVLRPAARSRGLLSALAAAGAAGHAVPVTSIGPPDDPTAFDAAVIGLAAGDFRWVGFTSVNAVDAVTARAAALLLHPAVPADTRVAAVGPATADAVHRAGLPVDLTPAGAGSAASLGAAWPAAVAAEAVLLPRSALATDTLVDALTGKGYLVRTVDAYRPEPVPLPIAVAEDLASGRYDAVVLTAGSVVGALARTALAHGTVVVTIGEPTAEAARRAGMTPVAADRPTDDGLVAALVAALKERSGG